MPKTNGKKNSDLPILDSRAQHERKKKTGRGKIRAAVLIAVHIVILVHIWYFFEYGRTLSPVEPSETMYAIEHGHVNAGAIFFGIAILSTAVFGRFFCGWGCHIVALQDLCSYALRRIGIRPKPLRSRLLVVVPFALAFYMFLWPTIHRLWYEVPHPGFTNHLITDDFWKYFPAPVIAIATFVVCGGLIVYLLGNKGFCTYACPYGAAFSIADRVAFGRIRVTDACHQCGQCTAACTSNVQVHAEVNQFGMVVDPGCMKCMDCVSVCPNDALYFSLTNAQPVSEVISINSERNGKSKQRKKTYDFTLAEEIFGLAVAAGSVYAIRRLYDITPLLLSTAVAIITGYLAIQFLRIFRKRDLRIQSFRLKRSGTITKTGWCAIICLSAWFAFNVHSFIVQYNRYQGKALLARVTASWPELLEGDSLRKRLSDDDRSNIEAGLKKLQLTDRIGLRDVMDVKLGLIYATMMKGDLQAAERYLREAHAINAPMMQAMLAEFLASQGRLDEANLIAE